MFPAGEEVIARTTVRWDKGLFTAVLKALAYHPCCKFSRGLFSPANSVPDRNMEPEPAHGTH
jgi:hypothetical protein